MGSLAIAYRRYRLSGYEFPFIKILARKPSTVRNGCNRGISSVILATKRRRSSVASLGNRHDGKKSKKQKHVNKKNEIFPHGNYRQYYGNVDEELRIKFIRL